MDGSQPQKTGTEKELLYSKVVLRGQSVELPLECIHMDDYGGDAKSLKHTVNDVLLKQYNIPENIVETLIVCCCADGASVNMGRKMENVLMNCKKICGNVHLNYSFY